MRPLAILPFALALSAACADEPPVPPPVAATPAPVPAPPPPAPPPSVPFAAAPETQVVIANAGEVVAHLRRGFRACYDAGLNDDPTMEGHVMLAAVIAPDGTVARVGKSAVEGLSAAVVECLASRLAPARFDAPGPKGSTIQIPITFRRDEHLRSPTP